MKLGHDPLLPGGGIDGERELAGTAAGPLALQLHVGPGGDGQLEAINGVLPVAAVTLLAHELRRPIAVIRGYASLLQEGSVDDRVPDRASMADKILHEAERMGDLVDGVLVAHPESFDAVAAVTLAADHVADSMQAAGATIAVESPVPDTPVMVRAVRAHVLCILTTLLANAITHATSPTRIGLRIETGDPVEIVVLDDGPGIPTEVQLRIFERGWRLREEDNGLGVGLAAGRELAELSGGSLRLKWSEAGQGSAFVLRLPAADRAATASSTATTSVGVDGDRPHAPWSRRIREWRMRHRWTQGQFAFALRRLDPFCQCDNGTVSRWERGVHRPSPLHEDLVCRIFEDQILAGADTPPDDCRAYVRHVLELDHLGPRGRLNGLPFQSRDRRTGRQTTPRPT